MDDSVGRGAREADGAPLASPAPSPAGARPAPPPRPVPPPITGPPPRVGPVSFVAPSPKPVVGAPSAKAPAAPSDKPGDSRRATRAVTAPATNVATADIRIPFARVADQLPRDVFLEPLDRLGQSLREPNVLVIPARVVAPQLAEGVVQVDWAVIESQFPTLASALPAPALRARFVGWHLKLPMDEVVRQLPSEVFAGATSVTPRGIDAFPPPFQPFSAGGGPTKASANAASVASPVAAPPRAGTTSSAPTTPARAPIAAAPASRSAPPVAAPAPPITPRPAPTPPTTPAPPITPRPAPLPSIATPAAAAPRPRVPPTPLGAPAPPVTAQPSAAAVAEAQTVVGELSRGAAFVMTVGVREGVTIATFTAAGVTADIAERVGRRAAPLLAAGACVAVRAADASVVAARGQHAILSATLRPPTPIAWADNVLARAAVSSAPSRPDDATSLSPAADARLAEAAAAFNGDALTFAQGFRDTARGLSLYVLAAPDARAAAALALRVWDTLLREPDAALAAITWVTVRRGTEVTIVRPLAGARAQLLVAVGEVERLGLAHRQAERAAAVLEDR